MKNSDLIRKLQDCAAACYHCADACLDEDNVEKMVSCIRLDRECAAICTATAELLAQDSKHAGELIALCEKLCRACAEECKQHENDHCQDCAKACQECEDACARHHHSVNVTRPKIS